MGVDGGSRDLIQRIAERSNSQRRTVGHQYGEDMRTLSIGSLSVSLGMVATASVANSLAGKAMGEWNVRQFYGVLTMSSIAAIVAIAGMIFGYLGLSIGWRSARRVSLLSALGLLSSYLAVSISLILVLYHEGSHWLEYLRNP